MSIQEVIVRPREGVGKGVARRLRRDGLIPSVVYGLKLGSIPISVEPKAINRIIHSEKGLNSVLDLRLQGTEQTRHVMIKAVDRHPVTDRLIHVDFLRINMADEIRVEIPIEYEGTPEGVKLGGVLTLVRHMVEVSCLPQNVPGTLRVDVSGLHMDESLRISDLPVLEGVTYRVGAKRVIAVVHAPDKGEEAAEEEDDDIEE